MTGNTWAGKKGKSNHAQDTEKASHQYHLERGGKGYFNIFRLWEEKKKILKEMVGRSARNPQRFENGIEG